MSRWKVGTALPGLVALLGTALAAAPAPAASATTEVITFASISSVAKGCRGASITGINESAGARYYYRGKRLHFPTKVLPYDSLGKITLTAEPARGHTVSQKRGQLLAPSECFTNIREGVLPRVDAGQSWCTTDSSPSLMQVFESDDLETTTGDWRLLRGSSHKVVARGQVKIYLGVGLVEFPLPADLPRGKYVLTVRDAASPRSLYPYSMLAEQYRCMKVPTVKTGAVTFKVPKNGPSVDLQLTGSSSPEETTVHIRAGHSYTYRTDETELKWIAYAHGNHVGTLGFGLLTIPQ